MWESVDVNLLPVNQFFPSDLSDFVCLVKSPDHDNVRTIKSFIYQHTKYVWDTGKKSFNHVDGYDKSTVNTLLNLPGFSCDEQMER